MDTAKKKMVRCLQVIFSFIMEAVSVDTLPDLTDSGLEMFHSWYW